MWPESPDGQNPSRQTPSWIDLQEDGTKSEQNLELTEPNSDTILRGPNAMWPDSQVDRIQVEKHPGGQTLM